MKRSLLDITQKISRKPGKVVLTTTLTKADLAGLQVVMNYLKKIILSSQIY